jgi:hypothetical protein
MVLMMIPVRKLCILRVQMMIPVRKMIPAMYTESTNDDTEYRLGR